MKYTQIGFFDTENRYEKLTQMGDPLEKLNGAIDWEMFREKLTAVCQKEDYTKGGRPPIDVIIKFKASVLRRIYNLSYDQVEYQINDRLSFMRFLGLSLSDKVLDSRTLWDFENRLAEAEVVEELFCMFDAMLESEDNATAVMRTRKSKVEKFRRNGKSPKISLKSARKIPMQDGRKKV